MPSADLPSQTPPESPVPELTPAVSKRASWVDRVSFFFLGTLAAGAVVFLLFILAIVIGAIGADEY